MASCANQQPLLYSGSVETLQAHSQYVFPIEAFPWTTTNNPMRAAILALMAAAL
jgi:hypothetical protein